MKGQAKEGIMRSLHYRAILVSILISTAVHAGTENEQLLKMFVDPVRSIDRAADWRLIDKDAQRATEIYYDSKSISDSTGKTKEVYIKIVYKSPEAIAGLKKRREREVKMRSASADVSGMKFEGLSYVLQKMDVSCSDSAIGVDSDIFDFDEGGNFLNYYHGIRSGGKIIAGSAGEKLYNVMCPKDTSSKINEKLITGGVAAPSVQTNGYRDTVSGIELIFVKGGCFQMGTLQQTGNPIAQMPVHEACMDDFYIGKYEVTQDQWRAVMGSEPIHTIECGGNCPATFVSWVMAQEFVDKLNTLTKKKYRLPTEAEWEYAARSRGQMQKYSGTDNESNLGEYAWYSENSKGRIYPVGLKKPNALGIYDMSGNLWEMVEDWYSLSYDANSPKNNPRGPSTGDKRVVRGGNYECSEKALHVSHRAGKSPTQRDSDTGFRLVLQP
jgi:formylglycine-generating enzyme required for sulfatase activity